MEGPDVVDNLANALLILVLVALFCLLLVFKEWGEQNYVCMTYFLAAWCWGQSRGGMRKTVFVLVINTVHGEVQIRASPLWHLQCILFFSFLWLPEFRPQVDTVSVFFVLPSPHTCLHVSSSNYWGPCDWLGCRRLSERSLERYYWKRESLSRMSFR